MNPTRPAISEFARRTVWGLTLRAVLAVSVTHAAPPVTPPSADQVQCIKGTAVRLDFDLWAGRGPLTSVDLWVTADQSASWKKADTPTVTESPVVWTPPRDGLYGLYLVVANAAGASSDAPTPGTAPQQWILVDRAPPRVTSVTAHVDRAFTSNRRVDIRWRATDAHLADRPIALFYQTASESLFVTIHPSLPNDGAFSWTVPDHVAGPITFRVVVRDRCGLVGEALSASVSLPDTEPAVAGARPGADLLAQTDSFGGDSERPPAAAPIARDIDRDSLLDAADPDAGRRRNDAQIRCKLGDRCAERGEWDLAEERYREALAIDPQSNAARRGLALALLRQRRYEAAQNEYDAILAADGDDIEALRGRATAQIGRRQYRSAGSTLEALLKLRPNDAEGLLAAGDVAMFSGDPAAARRAWERIRSLENVPSEVTDRVNKRIALLTADAAR